MATRAKDFVAYHIVRSILPIPDAALTGRFEEAWPSAIAGKLGVRSKQFVSTDSTIIGAPDIDVPILSGESTFSSLLTGDVVEVRRQNLFPNGVGHLQVRGVRVRIIRIVVSRRIWLERLAERRQAHEQEQAGDECFHNRVRRVYQTKQR